MARLLFFLGLAATLFAPSHQQEFVSPVEQNYKDRVNYQLEQLISHYVTLEVASIAYASYYERADVSLPGFHNFFSWRARTAGEGATNLTTFVNMRGGHVQYPVVQLKTACGAIREELKKGEITKPINSQSVTVTARRNPHICDFLLLDDPFTSHKKKKSSYLSWLYSAKKDKMTQDRDLWQEGLYGLEDALALEKNLTAEIISINRVTKTNTDPSTSHRLKHALVIQAHIQYQVAQLLDRLQDHRGLDTYALEEYLLDSDLMETYTDKPTEFPMV